MAAASGLFVGYACFAESAQAKAIVHWDQTAWGFHLPAQPRQPGSEPMPTREQRKSELHELLRSSDGQATIAAIYSRLFSRKLAAGWSHGYMANQILEKEYPGEQDQPGRCWP